MSQPATLNQSATPPVAPNTTAPATTQAPVSPPVVPTESHKTAIPHISDGGAQTPPAGQTATPAAEPIFAWEKGETAVGETNPFVPAGTVAQTPPALDPNDLRGMIEGMGFKPHQEAPAWADVYDPQSGVKLPPMPSRDDFAAAYPDNPELVAMYDRMAAMEKVMQTVMHDHFTKARAFEEEIRPIVNAQVVKELRSEYKGALADIKAEFGVDVPEQFFARELHPHLRAIYDANNGELSRKALANAWKILNQAKLAQLAQRNGTSGNVVQGANGVTPPTLTGASSVGGAPASQVEKFMAALSAPD